DARPGVTKVARGRAKGPREKAGEPAPHPWTTPAHARTTTAHATAAGCIWGHERSTRVAKAAVASRGAKAKGREKATENIHAAAKPTAAIGIAAAAAAEPAEGRAPGLIRNGVGTSRESPMLIRHNLCAPLLDDVHVVGAVAQVDCAAILPVATLQVIRPLEVIVRPYLSKLRNALAIRLIVRVVRRRRRPIGGVQRADQL